MHLNLIHSLHLILIVSSRNHHYLFFRLCSSPYALTPSQADWLNDLSSTPPTSVTIATENASSLLFSPDDAFSFSFAGFSSFAPHAPRIALAAKTDDNTKPNLRFFHCVNPPKVM